MVFLTSPQCLFCILTMLNIKQHKGSINSGVPLRVYWSTPQLWPRLKDISTILILITIKCCSDNQGPFLLNWGKKTFNLNFAPKKIFISRTCKIMAFLSS